MNCPLCNIPFEEKKFTNIYGLEEKAFQCNQCGGLFFKKLSGFKIKEEEAKKLDNVNKNLLNTRFPLQNRKIVKCPDCGNKMSKYINPLFKDLLIFVCENCKGLFFNKGQLIGFVQKRKTKKQKSPEKELLSKIYKTQGKEALLKAIPVIMPNKAELEKKVKQKTEKEMAKLILDTYSWFLLPLSPLKGRFIVSIFLTLFPFLEDILAKIITQKDIKWRKF
jgi:Zn-finger nucleic acid-binding protein